MNRFNYVGPAAQAISAFSAITSFTEGNRMQARAQKQQKEFTTDKIVTEEAGEVNKATNGNISAAQYNKENRKQISDNIKLYAKRYGESNAEAGYKLNEGARTEQGINTKENVIRNYTEAQRSVDEVKSKSSQPELDTNGVPDLLNNQEATTTDIKEV